MSRLSFRRVMASMISQTAMVAIIKTAVALKMTVEGMRPSPHCQRLAIHLVGAKK